MGERDSYAPGTFCWADLGTTDADAAKAFYIARVRLGGGRRPIRRGRHLHDVQARRPRRRRDVRDGRGGAGVATPHWSSYVSVEDVDALAGRVLELGGEVLAEPFDVMRAGRMTALRDPTGAAAAPVAAARAGRCRARQRPRLHGLERARHAGSGPRAGLLRRAAGLDHRARGVGLRRHHARRRAQRRHPAAPGRRADALARVLHRRLARRRRSRPSARPGAA